MCELTNRNEVALLAAKLHSRYRQSIANQYDLQPKSHLRIVIHSGSSSVPYVHKTKRNRSGNDVGNNFLSEVRNLHYILEKFVTSTSQFYFKTTPHLVTKIREQTRLGGAVY